MPSSLTILLPSALGFSPHPPVSVCGTGTYKTIAAFLDSQGPGLPYLCSVRVTSSDRAADLPTALLPRLHRDFHSRIPFPVCVPTVLFICGTGISTCYPSTTSFDLALGPDLQSRSALLWKPWIFGREDSHLSLATHSGILSSYPSTAPSGTASSVLRMLLYQSLT